MQLSPSDLALIRSQPQESNLFLNIYQPETILAGQVNGNISRNEMDIPVGAITTGTLGNVPDNFLLMVGSSAGANDYGTVRIRFSSGTHLCVAENNNIRWASGQYLTVINYIDIDAIYPRIIQKPGDPEDVIFLKDFDIVYTNQNSKLGSFVCMGPHRATFRDPATGLAQLYWSASGTYNVNGRSLTYDWAFEGATITGSSAETPGWVTYDHPGDFLTKLTVTAAYPGEDATDVSYRFVSIRDRPEAGPNRPLTQWTIDGMQGSRSEGGFTGRIKIWEPVSDIKYLKDGALVIVFSDDYYAGTRRNLGGNAENCSDIFFVGYILKGSIQYDFKEGSVEFDVGSVTEMMKMSQGFSVSCQDAKNPNTWFKIRDLNVPKAIYHYLRWHSTVNFTTDFQYLNDARIVQYFDTDRQSLYDAIATFLGTGLKGELVTDRQGKLWAQIAASDTYQAPTAFPVAMSVNKNDWGSNPPSNASSNAARAGGTASSPNITERIFPEYSYLEYGGIKYNGLGVDSDPLLTAAPGQTPGYKGGTDQIEGFILTSQLALNQQVGAAFAYANSKYPEIYFSLAGAYKNLDIAPIENVQLNVDATDTPRGIVLVNEPFHITSAEWSYSPSTKSLIQTPHFAQLVSGLNGETIPVPPPPDDSGNNVPGTKVPPFGFGFPRASGTPAVFAYYDHIGIAWNGVATTPDTDETASAGITIVGSLIGASGTSSIIRFIPGAAGYYLCGINMWVPNADFAYPYFLGVRVEDSANREYGYNKQDIISVPYGNGDPNFVQWSGMIFLNAGGNYLDFALSYNSTNMSSAYHDIAGIFCDIYMLKIA